MTFRLLILPLIIFFHAASFAQSDLTKTETVFSGEVYFDFGKHDLRPEADSILSKLAIRLTNQKNLLVKITAHTDSIGSLKDNLALSGRRSESVQKALIQMGIPDSLFSIDAFGETKPAASNNTDQGRQLNRRVTIEIIKQTNAPIQKAPEITTTQLEGNIMDKESGVGLEAMVIIRGKDFRDTIFTDSSGYYQKKLPIGMVVGVDAYATCHFFGSEMTKTEVSTVRLDMQLAPIKSGGILDLNNLYYVGNQAVLLEKSRPELPKILRFMQLNPEMRIEVAGHINLPNTPNVATDTWHYKLSHDRAKVVYDYLISNGIPSERVSYKGYGNWEMRYPNAVDEREQALNRRVEMKVLEGGCE